MHREIWNGYCLAEIHELGDLHRSVSEDGIIGVLGGTVRSWKVHAVPVSNGTVATHDFFLDSGVSPQKVIRSDCGEPLVHGFPRALWLKPTESWLNWLRFVSIVAPGRANDTCQACVAATLESPTSEEWKLISR
jgi:hypothetical protein